MTHRRRHESDNTPLQKREIGVVVAVVCVVWAVKHSTAEGLSSRRVTGDRRRYSLCKLRRGRVTIKSVGSYCGPPGSSNEPTLTD